MGKDIVITVPGSDQQRDWFERERIHRNPDLIISFRIALAADLTPKACRAVLARLVARHGALRTCFGVRGGVVSQLVHRDVPDDCFWHEDLRGLSEERRSARYAELVARERQREYDLERLPLVHVGLIRMSAEHAVISVTMHHVIADGWAVHLLHRELAELLASEVSGEPEALAPAMQCHEWSEAERRWASGPEAAAQLEHWKRELADVRPLSLPPTKASGPPGEFEHAEVHVTADAAVHANLTAAARRLRTTVPMLALGAYLKQLAKTSGRDDVSTMTMVTGRSLRGYDTVVGSLTNVLTVHVEGAATATVADLMPQVRDRLTAAYANQRIFVSRVWEQTHLGPGDVDSLFIADNYYEPPTRFGPYPLLDTPDEGPRSFRRRGPWWENFKVRYLAAPHAPVAMVEYNANQYDEGFARSFATEYLASLGNL